jgi:regulatory protein
VSVADHPAPRFRDAEAWLAERGVTREPIHVAIRPEPEDASSVTGSGGAGPDRPVREAAAREARGEVGAREAGGEVGAREARRLLGQADLDASLAAAERDVAAPTAPGLEDDVARAVAFIRRSTAGAPQAEGRLHDKLLERGHPEQVVTLALERARRERLVDDHAMAAALVDEKRRAGHAPARIRRDLRGRGFRDEVLDPLLATAESEDQEAAAFALAAERAARLTGVAAETAYRRVVGHVTRRGYPEALARKVARTAVFSSREQERAAGR